MAVMWYRGKMVRFNDLLGHITAVFGGTKLDSFDDTFGLLSSS